MLFFLIQVFASHFQHLNHGTLIDSEGNHLDNFTLEKQGSRGYNIIVNNEHMCFDIKSKTMKSCANLEHTMLHHYHSNAHIDSHKSAIWKVQRHDGFIFIKVFYSHRYMHTTEYCMVSHFSFKDCRVAKTHERELQFINDEPEHYDEQNELSSHHDPDLYHDSMSYHYNEDLYHDLNNHDGLAAHYADIQQDIMKNNDPLNFLQTYPQLVNKISVPPLTSSEYKIFIKKRMAQNFYNEMENINRGLYNNMTPFVNKALENYSNSLANPLSAPISTCDQDEDMVDDVEVPAQCPFCGK